MLWRGTIPPVLLLIVGLPLMACGADDDGLSCGPGTVESAGQCVADGTDDPDRGRRSVDEADAGPQTDMAEVAEVGSADATGPDTDAAPDQVASPDTTAPESDPVVDAPAQPRDDSTCTAEGVATEAIGFWTGTWDGYVEGDHPLTGPFHELAFGDLSFEIFCENSKLLIEGEMSGLANNAFPFGGDLIGEFNPDTGVIDIDLVNASVNMMIMTVEFVADLTGDLVGDTFQNGVWSGYSTNPTGATGEGTWTASRAP